MDWLDVFAVQGTLKSLLQHHSSKASILQRSAFFIVQLSHPDMTTGKTIALTWQTFVGKVMSLLFNMLSNIANQTKHPEIVILTIPLPGLDPEKIIIWNDTWTPVFRSAWFTIAQLLNQSTERKKRKKWRHSGKARLWSTSQPRTGREGWHWRTDEWNEILVPGKEARERKADITRLDWQVHPNLHEDELINRKLSCTNLHNKVTMTQKNVRSRRVN